MPETPTLASLVDEHPHAARVLERHGLDYCCGGAQRLDAACATAGIDPAAVLDAIAAEAPQDPRPALWATMSPVELVDHVERTHHRYLDAELPRLAELAAKVRGVHGERHPELVRIHATFTVLQEELEPHLRKEELVLFPLIRRLATSGEPVASPGETLRNPISVMLSEHDLAGELLAELRRLTEGYVAPADACGSYRALYEGLEALEADTHLHVHKENNVLFPAVEALEAARA